MLREPTGAAARPLTQEKLSALLAETAGTRLEGPVLLALNHGLRESEIIHVRRDAVDVARATLWIRHDPLSGWLVKNEQERLICLNETTRPWLARHLAEPPQGLSPYVFSMQPGRPWTRMGLVMAIRRVMRRIGIPRGGLHMLRHHWATCQAEAGTPIPVLKALGGWRDFRSMATYQHVGYAALREAAARVVIGPHPATEQVEEKVVSLDLERARRQERGAHRWPEASGPEEER
jgi:integrase